MLRLPCKHHPASASWPGLRSGEGWIDFGVRLWNDPLSRCLTGIESGLPRWERNATNSLTNVLFCSRGRPACTRRTCPGVLLVWLARKPTAAGSAGDHSPERRQAGEPSGSPARKPASGGTTSQQSDSRAWDSGCCAAGSRNHRGQTVVAATKVIKRLAIKTPPGFFGGFLIGSFTCPHGIAAVPFTRESERRRVVSSQ
jgi:hypothetical protein